MPALTDLLILVSRRAKARTTLVQATVSFNERSYILTTLAVESFGRFGKSGIDFVDQLTTRLVGGSQEKQGVVKEHPQNIISVTLRK